MAAPITHIVLSHKIYNKHFFSKDKKKFYVGTSFPDIRYLGVIEREKTHFERLELEDIVTEESFVAGIKFHSFVDEVREQFVIDNEVYKHLPESPYVTQALKFFEDEILYDKIEDWKPYIGYFEQILEEERSFGISDIDLEKWHSVLRQTFTEIPTEKGLEEFIRMIGKPEKMSTEINKIVSLARTDKYIIDYVHSLYDKFDELIIQ